MSRTDSRVAARLHLAAGLDIATQDSNVFVIQIGSVRDAELANFTSCEFFGGQGFGWIGLNGLIVELIEDTVELFINIF